MQDPHALEGRPTGAAAESEAAGSTRRSGVGRRRHRRAGGTTLSVVERPADLDDDPQILGELAHKLATALRAVRGHVSDPIWWDTGAADALIEYQARRAR